MRGGSWAKVRRSEYRGVQVWGRSGVSTRAAAGRAAPAARAGDMHPAASHAIYASVVSSLIPRSRINDCACSSVFRAIFREGGRPSTGCSSDSDSAASPGSHGMQQQQRTVDAEACPSKSRRATGSCAGGGGVAMTHVTRSADAGQLLQAINRISRCALCRARVSPLMSPPPTQKRLLETFFASFCCA